jgi:hypothetical protein
MNSEQDSAYKNIVEALQTVNQNRTFRNIGTPERQDLDKAVLLLEELSWEIVSEDIADFAERIGAAAKELKVLADKIDGHYDHLKCIAGVIRKAADAAGFVAGIAGEII